MAHSGKSITFGTDLLPQENNVYYLGKTDQKWKTIYTDDINLTKINGQVPVLTDTNTDTLQNVSLATTTKAYITGVTTTPTSTAAAMTAVADTGIYTTTTAGELSAVRHSWNVSGVEKAHTEYDATNDCINFIFD